MECKRVAAYEMYDADFLGNIHYLTGRLPVRDNRQSGRDVFGKTFAASLQKGRLADRLIAVVYAEGHVQYIVPHGLFREAVALPQQALCI